MPSDESLKLGWTPTPPPDQYLTGRSMTLAERIEHDFKYHPATPLTGPQHDQVRAVCKGAALQLAVLLDEGQELSLAIRSLEEAMFWANAGIARGAGK